MKRMRSLACIDKTSQSSLLMRAGGASAEDFEMPANLVRTGRRRFPVAMLAMLPLFAGCARVTVTALDANGKPSGEAEGVRYYMPKPYLLVMNLSGVSSAGQQANLPPEGKIVDPKTGKTIGPPGGAGTPPAAADGDSSGKTTPSGATAAPSATGDTSYMAADVFTVAKLVYLPDYSHPMAITEFPGLFGTVSMNASLQDGWMLTSLQGSGDSKTAETLTAAASLASAIGGSLSGAGAVKGAAKPPGGAGETSSITPGAITKLLPPGLYALVYNSEKILTGLCLATAFDDQPNSVPPCQPGSAGASSPAHGN